MNRSYSFSVVICICLCLMVAINSVDCVGGGLKKSRSARVAKMPSAVTAPAAPASGELASPESPVGPPAAALNSVAQTANVGVKNLANAKLESQMIEMENNAPSSWADCQEWAKINDQFEAGAGYRHRPSVDFAKICKVLKVNYDNAVAKVDQINQTIEQNDDAFRALAEILQSRSEVEEAAGIDPVVAGKLDELKSGPLGRLLSQLAGLEVEQQNGVSAASATATANADADDATPLTTSVETKEHLAQLDSQLKAIILDNEQDGQFDDGQRERVNQLTGEMKDLMDHQWHDSVLESSLFKSISGTYDGAMRLLSKNPPEYDD